MYFLASNIDLRKNVNQDNRIETIHILCFYAEFIVYSVVEVAQQLTKIDI